jgi:ABC-type transport system involved in multi-copper enzyme maturation permease subunit
MLWYKAWLETRDRFFICLALMMVPAYTLFTALPSGLNETSVYFKVLFKNNVLTVGIWIGATIFLGMGGLLRERAIGSSAFTLALPVSRAKLILIRAGTGILESIALAIAPWLFIFTVCKFCGTPFSISQAGCCILLLLGCGSMYFGFAILISSLIEGEYSAAAAACGILLVLFIVMADPSRMEISGFFFSVIGTQDVDRGTFLFLGSLPWMTMLGNLSAAVVMVLAAIAVTRRRDF